MDRRDAFLLLIVLICIGVIALSVWELAEFSVKMAAAHEECVKSCEFYNRFKPGMCVC
jgi:hypothetical protein